MQLATNAADAQSTIKDIVGIIDTKLENITIMFKQEIKDMFEKLNRDINNITKNIDAQEININKLQEIGYGILRSEGENYVVVK